ECRCELRVLSLLDIGNERTVWAFPGILRGLNKNQKVRIPPFGDSDETFHAGH
ncbi:MAG: hypothetical protein ACI8P0_003844, partial [Planctomycetaceae bacterium]